MASVPSSGPISFTDIQAVMGGSGPVSIQDYIQSAATGYAKGVPGIGDTNLNITDFQGKSKALVSGLQYRLFRKRYAFSSTTGSGSAGTGLYGGGGGAGGVTVMDYTSSLSPNSSATAASGTTSGGAGAGFGAGGGGTGVISARYIRFQYGNGYGGVGRCMNLGGVRVYSSSTGGNIIVSTMATTVSTTSGGAVDVYAAGYESSNMVDNNDNTMYHSSCATEYPFVRIDLGSEQPIYKVELINRVDCCRSRAAGITLQLQNGSGTVIYTSGLCALPNGSTTYADNIAAYLYYSWWPAINTTPYGSDSTPYASPPSFSAGQGASGFAYIQNGTTEYFTNSSISYTFTSAGTAKLLLMGGGGGGGTNAGANSRGGGGGGAGYLQSYFIPVTSGAVATLTVGGPGTADVSGGTTSAVINSITYTAAGGGNGNATQTGGAGSSAGGSGGSAGQASGGGRSFIKARYVLFDYGNGNGGGGRYLHFMTVRVYSTPGGSNITTPSMTVSASSAAASASLIIDNDDTTLWHSGLEEYPWIMVDLGSEQFIHKVELMNRTDCCRGRIAGARLVLRNNAGTAIYTSNLMTLKNGTTAYQEWPGNDGYLYYNWWPAANTIAYGSDTTPYADIPMNQSGAPAIGHLTNDGGYFADDPTWFDSRTENYPAGLVTNFTNINTATGGIVPTDSSWQTYSVEWFGYFYATVTGTYTFFTNTDDASYLWVGASALSGYTIANCLVNSSGIHAVQERSGTISLTAGTYYPIRFQFGQNTSGDGCALSFSAPGITRTYNLAGYVYYGMGTYSSFPINHARLLRATNATTVDRSYFVNIAGTATPTYCLMDSKWDGGGWMMMLKATRGTTFPYSSTYWTDSATTLNTGSTNRTDGDAKFAVMNQTPVKDVLALWPDVGTTGGSISQTEAWSWMINNYYYGGARVTPIVGFSSSNSRDATTHFLNTSEQTSFAGYSASIWSQQAGAKRHVFGGGTHLSSNANVRWGFIWNNENDFATVDVTSGLGMSHATYSAGDYYGGAGTSVLNRSTRVELYGR
jgi:hypothetical protein